MIRNLPRYLGVAQTYLKLCLAFRFAFAVSLVVGLAFAWILISLWSAIWDNSEAVRAEFGRLELITYIGMGQVLDLARMGLANRGVIYRPMSHIYSGRVVVDLTRPLDVQGMRLAEWSAVLIYDTFLVALPIWIVLRIVWGIEGPASAEAGILFAVSFVIGWMVTSAINFIVTVLSVWTVDALGLNMAKVAVQQFFSGSLIPLTLMPVWLGVVAEALPFRAVVFTPVYIYLGKLTGWEALGAIGLQAVWLAALVLLGRLLWRRALPHVLVFGG